MISDSAVQQKKKKELSIVQSQAIPQTLSTYTFDKKYSHKANEILCCVERHESKEKCNMNQYENEIKIHRVVIFCFCFGYNNFHFTVVAIII